MTQARTVLYATLGVIAVIVVAWMFLIYRPKGDEISDLEEQVAQAQDVEASLRTQLARLEELDEERPSVEAELRRLTAAVPPEPELATLILTMHDQATRAGIDFLQFTPAPPTPGEDAAVISAGLNLEGSFFTVLDFLDRVEGLDRIIVVDSLEMTAGAPEQPVAAGPEQPSQETGAAGTAPDAMQDTAVDASDLVTISTEFGQVTTDAASLDEGPDGAEGSDGQAGAALVTPEPVIPVGAFTVQMTLQVRTFTTAQPETAGEDGTTTTVPPGGQSAATTTTVAGGG